MSAQVFEPRRILIFSPMPTKWKGQPQLAMYSPINQEHNYVLGFGLEYMHEGGLAATVYIDCPGDWKYEWKGLESNESLEGVMIVVPVGSGDTT